MEWSIWFRIFYAFGFEQRKNSLIPYLISSFKNNKIPKIKNIKNANDFIYIKDIVTAFEKALKLNNFIGVINLGSGKSISVLNICKIIEKKLNGTTIISNNINKKSSAKQDEKFCANIDIAKKILKWSPKYKLNKAIKEMIYDL